MNSATIIKYGNLSIDKDKCCAYKDGEPIELGAKDKLLLYFENPKGSFNGSCIVPGRKITITMHTSTSPQSD